MNELRPYQVQGINKCAGKAAEGIKRMIFQLATGGGKTVCFAGLTYRYLNKQQRRILILVHREELLNQARSTLYKWNNIVAVPVTSETKLLPNAMVYVAMVETAYNRLKKNPNYFGEIGLVIVDECHIGNFKKIYSIFDNSLIIGFTATPISSSRHDPLNNYFQDIVCGIDIPELINQKSLVKNKTYCIKNVQSSELTIKNGEFDERQMSLVYSSQRNVQNTVNAYKKYSLGKKTIIFNCDIEHSKKVDAAFVSHGFNSRHLDGDAPKHVRSEILLWFKNTPDAILNNIGVLTTGFDEPSVLTVLVNKDTMSLPLWLQMTGRGARPYPDKDEFTIIDMGTNSYRHNDWSIARDWSDIFFNPPKPGAGGDAPVKACVACSVLIPLAARTCEHCGANNYMPPKYDEMIIKLELFDKERPVLINVQRLIAQNKNKEYSTLHVIKKQIIMHARNVWSIKKMNIQTSDKLLSIYQEKVKEWCQLTGKNYNGWHKNKTTEWFYDELKSIYKWEPVRTLS